MAYYPILIELEGKNVVVVGGGVVAQRKIDTLLECGAVVHVISKKLTPALQKYIKSGKIRSLGHEFEEIFLQDAFLVIAATSDSALNHRISKIAQERKMLVNVVDQPYECNFIIPSIIKRGDLLIAVSTSGKSPALAKKLREKLTGQFGGEYEDFLILMGKLRKEILSMGLAQKENSKIFHELVDSPILEALRRKDWKTVALNINRILHSQISHEDVIKYLKVE